MCCVTDAREASEYVEAHILLAKGVKRDEKGERKIPFGVHLQSLLHCVVYDGNTVSIVEDSEFNKINFISVKKAHACCSHLNVHGLAFT